MASNRKGFYGKRTDTTKPNAAFNLEQLIPGTGSSIGARNLEVEHQLVELSGFFDPSFYVNEAGKESLIDPIRHYLTVGWMEGLEPNSDFPGTFLLPYYRSIGFLEPPLLTWLTLKSGGGFTPCKIAEIEEAAGMIRSTDLFDPEFYSRQFGVLLDGLDPAVHYAVVGESLGIPCSSSFDPGYYRTRYPDMAQCQQFVLKHYADQGRREGRRPKPANQAVLGDAVFRPQAENVLLIVHEASRTGAPILGWNMAKALADRYNLHTIHLGGGDLTREFKKLSTHILGVLDPADRHEADLEPALKSLLGSRQFRYAIVNSAESRALVELLAKQYIPTILLVHEFGAYVYPHSTFRSALDWAAEVVFPARIVAGAAAEVHPVVQMRSQHILPQGASALPPTAEVTRELPSKALQKLTRLHDKENLFIVLGAGTVHLRKGVELFIAAAAKVARTASDRKIHFLWVGHGFNPKQDMAYSMYLQEQVNRSQVSDSITFLDAVSDLDSVYRIADAFFLCSRLDPLPNVSIDAALLGIPLVCFRNASGTAELLEEEPEAALGIVEHLDAEGAGEFIIRLAGDAGLHRRLSEATRKFAATRFAMQTYVSQLDRIGSAAQVRLKQQRSDAETLRDDPTFDQDMFLGTDDLVESREKTIARYLTLGAARTWKPIVVANTALRRPHPGFNPRLYASEFPETLLGQLDPLAEYIRRGKPEGPWQAQVLLPDLGTEDLAHSGNLRVALHAHLHYPDMAQDLLAHLASNRTDCDLFITTNNPDKVKELEKSFGSYHRGLVEIIVVPNRGRNFGPLLTGLPERLSGYDLIGHVHGKRSVGKPGEWSKGNEWREFLWQNLLGGQHAMLDRIVQAFEHQDDLGLVFPSDPHFVGWDQNLPVARALALRLGWTAPLPASLDFPLGAMFWVRRQALQPLLDAKWGWSDYPEEPLADDGTILHALERLLPTICCDLAGFKYAVTHVPGVSWNS